MRTSAVLLALLIAAPAAADEPTFAESRLEVGVPAEVTLVGLTAGVRPEVLFRLGEPGARSRLRFAVGVLAGPDHLLVPLSVGYRAVFRQGSVVQPLLGAGLEGQLRFVSDYPLVRSLGVYLEGGVGFVLSERWSLGAMVSVDVMVFGVPGFGLGPRVLLSYRL